MGNIMLVVLSLVKIEKVIENIFKLVEERNSSKLYVAFFFEKETPSFLSSLTVEGGYLGEKMIKDIHRTLLDKYKHRIEELKTDIITRAEKKEIEVKIQLIEENSRKYCYNLIRKNDINQLVINYTDNKYMAQIMSNYLQKDFFENLSISCDLYIDGELSSK